MKTDRSGVELFRFVGSADACGFNGFYEADWLQSTRWKWMRHVESALCGPGRMSRCEDCALSHGMGHPKHPARRFRSAAACVSAACLETRGLQREPGIGHLRGYPSSYQLGRWGLLITVDQLL